jgi:hydrogenase-4 component F
MHQFLSGEPLFWGIALPPLTIVILSVPIRYVLKPASPGKRESSWHRTGSFLRQRNWTFVASCVSSLCSLWALLSFPHQGYQFEQFGIRFSIDALSMYFIVMTNGVAIFASYFTRFTTEQIDEKAQQYEQTVVSIRHFRFYYNLLYCALLLASMVDSLLLTWILMAFITVTSAFLIGNRSGERARQAARKYINVCAPAMLAALLGVILVAVFLPVGSNMLLNWSLLTQGVRAYTFTPVLNEQVLAKLSFLLVLLGYGASAYMWLPSALSAAPSPVSAMISGALLKTSLYVILRFSIVTNLALVGPGGKTTDHFVPATLLITGMLSLVIATAFALNLRGQDRFKPLLTYLSLEHMGIILFGFGLSSALAFFGALVHTLTFSLAATFTFLVDGTVQAKYAEKGIKEKDIRGVMRALPFSGSLLAVGSLALAGTPPFNASLSEFMIIWAALQMVMENPIAIVTICVFLISVTLIFAAVVAHLGRSLLGKEPFKERSRPRFTQLLVPGMLLLLVSLLIVGGFTTFPLTAVLQQSVNILCQGRCQ